MKIEAVVGVPDAGSWKEDVAVVSWVCIWIDAQPCTFWVLDHEVQSDTVVSVTVVGIVKRTPVENTFGNRDLSEQEKDQHDDWQCA